MRHLALILLAAAAPLPALASQVNVSPTRLALAPESPVAVLTLTNSGAETARFELDVSAWDEADDGQMVLGPTDALVVFPKMIELPPGQSRPVRVASRHGVAGAQRTFRVFVSELPRPGGTGKTIQVLSRFGVPVFVGPSEHAPRVEVSGVRVAEDGQLEVRLANRGAGFGFVRKLFAQASGPALEWTGWYLLSGHERVYRAPLPAEDRKSPVRIRVELEDGSVVEHSANLPG